MLFVEKLSDGTAAVFENIVLTEGKNIRSEVKDSLEKTRLYVVGKDEKNEIAIDGGYT